MIGVRPLGLAGGHAPRGSATTFPTCAANVVRAAGSLQLAKLLPECRASARSKGKKAITIVGLPSQQDALTQLTSGRLRMRHRRHAS